MRAGVAGSAVVSERGEAEQAAADHLQRRLRGLVAHALAVAREVQRGARASPAAPSSAMKTRPTGLSGVPPSGPAMPVMATPMSVPAPRGARPRPWRRATSSETAPCGSITAGSTPSSSTFDRLL